MKHQLKSPASNRLGESYWLPPGHVWGCFPQQGSLRYKPALLLSLASLPCSPYLWPSWFIHEKNPETGKSQELWKLRLNKTAFMVAFYLVWQSKTVLPPTQDTLPCFHNWHCNIDILCWNILFCASRDLDLSRVHKQGDFSTLFQEYDIMLPCPSRVTFLEGWQSQGRECCLLVDPE